MDTRTSSHCGSCQLYSSMPANLDKTGKPKHRAMKINYNKTPYAKTVKKTGKRNPGDRLIDNQKFYSSRKWRKARAEWIKIYPLCERCNAEGQLTPGDVVDHIVPVEVDPTLSLDGDNLQTLCHKHHNEKTQEDIKKYPEVYKDYDKYYK